MNVKSLIRELKSSADIEAAARKAKFFKAFPGGYGEGDQFLGINVPVLRSFARTYKELEIEEIGSLIRNDFHEIRLVALFILVNQFQRNRKNPDIRQQIVDFYLDNITYVNNWDLVDSSCYKILGPYLEKRDKSLLYSLADETDIWKKRIAMVTCYHFIKQGNFEDTFNLARILCSDQHDIIQKAVGWMLKEVGKFDQAKAIEFLTTNNLYKGLPRTTLRYAIEKYDEALRLSFLNGTI